MHHTKSDKSKSGSLQRHTEERQRQVKMWKPSDCRQQPSRGTLMLCSDRTLTCCVQSPEASVPKVRTVRIYHCATSFKEKKKSEYEIWTRCSVRHHWSGIWQSFSRNVACRDGMKRAGCTWGHGKYSPEHIKGIPDWRMKLHFCYRYFKIICMERWKKYQESVNHSTPLKLH